MDINIMRKRDKLKRFMVEHTIEVIFERIDIDDDDQIKALADIADTLLANKTDATQTRLVALVTYSSLSDTGLDDAISRYIEEVLNAVPTAMLIKIIYNPE